MAGKPENRVSRVADRLSGFLIFFALLFAPWALGSTLDWAKWILNCTGYLLALLLLLQKIYHVAPAQDDPPASRPLRLLAIVTCCILLYCGMAAVNRAATYHLSDLSFIYYNHLPWLPHSYDSRSSWRILFDYSALASFFWATIAWLRRSPAFGKSPYLPNRVKFLVWLICLNGALLSLQGMFERVADNGKLLWLHEPEVNKNKESFFGPFAYRANAAAFLNLTWPVALGFWLCLDREAARKRGESRQHHLLFPIAATAFGGAVMTLSRGGAVVAGTILICGSLAWVCAQRRDSFQRKALWMIFVLATIAGGIFISWKDLSARFAENAEDPLQGRRETYALAKKMAADYPWFGTGPNTFDHVFQLYRISPEAYWPAQLHDDWLETLITFGVVGSVLIAVAFLLALLHWFAGPGTPVRWFFPTFIWLSLFGCLAHAKFDFPLQVYSILHLFLTWCAVLCAISRRKN